MVGVHSPEFPHERDADAVRKEARRHDLGYSHFLDNDQAYWKALRNEYWPTVYLVDRCGILRDRHIGEVHSGDDAARGLETAIERLLAEIPDCGPE